MKQISNEQAAFMAGFIEGEGSFTIRSRGGGSYGPSVDTKQRDPKVLKFLHRVTGVGIVSDKRMRITRVNHLNTWIYRWSVRRQSDVVSLVSAIYPYLISSRTKRRAWCIYRFAKLVNSNSSHPLSLENKTERQRIYSIWDKTRRWAQ